MQPGQRCPLHFLRTGQEKLLTVAYPGLNTQWSSDFTLFRYSYTHSFHARSPPFNIEDIGLVHFRLRGPGGNQPHHLMRVHSKIEGSTIFLNLCSADEGWPFMIENGSDYEVVLCQAVSISLYYGRYV